MARRTPAGTPALRALAAAGVEHTALTYEHVAGAGYGLEAAHALGLDPDQVLKTLLAEVNGELVVAVVPVSGTLDLKALAAALGGKRAVMAPAPVAERATGYVVGGISPLGQRTRLRTVVDESAELFETVYVSGGRRGLDVGLAPGDLVRLTDALVADVARG